MASAAPASARDLDAYRERADRFIAALDEEYYLHFAGHKEKLEIEEVPEPEAGPDEVVVKVLACGFCGSDLEYYSGRSPLGTADGKGPLVLGHEICGQVVQAPPLAEQYGLAEGDRVALNPVQSCNACNACRAGKLQFCQNLTVLGVTIRNGA